MIIVYITCKNKAEAKKISDHLLKKKLIACANLYNSDSMYKWKGKKVTEKEVTIFAKTADKHFSAIKKEVTKIHSYDIPCILKIKVEANAPYAKWVSSEV